MNSPASQPARQTTMWEFSHSAEEACCANSLHDWALPNKHTPVQSTCQTSSRSLTTAPKMCVRVCLWGGQQWVVRQRLILCEILNSSGKFITHFVRVVTSICPHPIFQVMLSHLLARKPKGKNLHVFHNGWLTVDVCSLFLSLSLAVWEMCWEMSPGTGTSCSTLPVMWRLVFSAKEMSH